MERNKNKNEVVFAHERALVEIGDLREWHYVTKNPRAAFKSLLFTWQAIKGKIHTGDLQNPSSVIIAGSVIVQAAKATVQRARHQ